MPGAPNELPEVSSDDESGGDLHVTAFEDFAQAHVDGQDPDTLGAILADILADMPPWVPGAPNDGLLLSSDDESGDDLLILVPEWPIPASEDIHQGEAGGEDLDIATDVLSDRPPWMPGAPNDQGG